MQKENVLRRKEYFEELKNKENVRERRLEEVELVDQVVRGISRDEMKTAVKIMKDEKAIGPDRLPVEAWRSFEKLVVIWRVRTKDRLLSPFLTDEIRRESPRTVMFSNDIVLCGGSREKVEKDLVRWRYALERRGMNVSKSKTDYMYKWERWRGNSEAARCRGVKANKFKYLGSTKEIDCVREVKKEVQAGWSGWRRVTRVVCDRRVSARMEGKVYKTSHVVWYGDYR
ncbi:uncharacterized protein [Penaeus vannamei]|uniref:uncharacterized protein n=1 Tax=Penaeus vannamei TaxID=6689 RepID=UPI00387F68A1